MENRTVERWQAQEFSYREKDSSWYMTVGIIAGGAAIASIIFANYLFALICVLGGFSVMLMGSRRPRRFTFSVNELDIAIGRERIPYEKIKRFAIKEDEPRELTIEMDNLVGIMHLPLGDADHREIRRMLKNKSIDEVEELDTFVTRFSRWMGL